MLIGMLMGSEVERTFLTMKKKLNKLVNPVRLNSNVNV